MKNPILQAREYSSKVFNLIKSSNSLLQDVGEYRGNPKFPIGKCVVFTNLSRKEASEINLINNAIIPNQQAIFSDDLNFDLDNKEQCKDFVRKIKNTLKHDYLDFSFEPLNYKELMHLRHILFPEIRIGEQSQKQNFDSVKALSVEQEKVAKNIGEGHRILKGVAGSGKSVVLSCRAKYLQQIYPDWKILVVCFNLNLLNQLKQNILTDKINNNITISHFHGLVKNITKENLMKLEGEEQIKYNERIANLFLKYISENDTQKYQAILIDEGQDLLDDWVRGLTNLIDVETNSILFCYDPAQNVFGRKRPNWKSVGLSVQGKKPTELKECYRNTKEILELASLFSNTSIDSIIEEDELTSRLIPNTEFCHSGSKPVIKQLNYKNDLIDYLIYVINGALKSKKYTFKDIGVILTPGNNDILSKLKKEISNVYGEDSISYLIKREEKLKFDPSSNSIKVMYIEGCKGLEFPLVFYIGLDKMPRPDRDAEAEKCLAYVGVTRAQEHLFIPYQDNSGYINEINEYLEMKHLTV